VLLQCYYSDGVGDVAGDTPSLKASIQSPPPFACNGDGDGDGGGVITV
jgi:hypothetical protein